MTDLAPDLAPGLKSAFTASLATRSNHLMLALEIRMAENWAADAARAEVRRARINQLGIKDGARSTLSTGPGCSVHIRAMQRARMATIIEYLRHHASLTTKQAAVVSKMSREYARITLNGMVGSGTLTRTEITGHASIYRLAEPVPPQMQNGVTP